MFRTGTTAGAAVISIALLTGCYEQSDAPAAQVSEPAATVDTSGSPVPAGKETVVNVLEDESSIEFVGAKVTGSHVGTFREFDGHVQYVDGEPNNIEFEFDLSSVRTDAERLDKHLKSEDFFWVERFPKAVFRSTAIEKIETPDPNGSTHRISGVLDLRGEQKQITFPAKVTTVDGKIHATSEFTIDRHDWNVSYKGAPDDLIRDEVELRLDLWFPQPSPARTASLE